MTRHLFDSLSPEMWRKEVEQMLQQHHADIIQLIKRAPQRPAEWMGHLPHAPDAFSGAGTPESPPEALRFLEGILDGDLAQSTSDGTGETTATLSIWQGEGGSWADTGENITVTNRADTFSAKAGEYLQVRETIDGEFRPIFFPSVLRLAKTDSSHNKGASGTVSIYVGTAGSESNSGDNATAINKFADLASGKWTIVGRIDGDEYLLAGECD